MDGPALSSAAASVAGVQDALRLRLLAELGVLQYLPRDRVAVAAAVAVPQRAAPAPAQRPLPDPVQPVTASGREAVAVPAGQRTLRFAGPADSWKGLRRHLLECFGAVESTAAADVMFGGTGSVLTLPALGALAANPALKRQAWMALRALRRSA